MCSVQLIYQQNGRALICLNVSGRRYIYDPNANPSAKELWGQYIWDFRKNPMNGLQ